MTDSMILQVAVPSPLLQLFDYLAAEEFAANCQAGMRIRVPFGKSHRIGLIIATKRESDIKAEQLKTASELLDSEPLLDDSLLRLLQWASQYYHHSLGQIIHHCLPTLLRQGQAALLTSETLWQLTPMGQKVTTASINRAPRQAELLLFMQQSAPPGQAVGSQQLTAITNWRQTMKALADKGWVESTEQTDVLRAVSRTGQTALEPNDQQQSIVKEINQQTAQFQCYLLDGVTGSGKTEVYFALIEKQMALNQQVLVLVPEIGLTPQLVERFQQRFEHPIVVLHSALSDRERLNAWLYSRLGQAAIMIGTRSAVFVPCPRLGLIIIDEEHDPSFKQQDGFRYHARDIAIVRAQQKNIPIVLGSATPSLESLLNARQQRFKHLRLTERPGGSQMPSIELIDIRHLPLNQGLSPRLIDAMHAHLQANNQVLLFLNRRGFAPTLLCHDCGWVARCEQCDAHMIYHHKRALLRCHHCESQRPYPAQCPACQSTSLLPLGLGTERIEQALHEQFSDCEILRIDRDSLRSKNALQDLFARIKQGQRQILLGTQMLAKGHDLPNVTLAGIILADQGLFSIDFRASERLGQMVIQVAGRAGRSEKPGEVLIQTHHPEHPLLQNLVQHDYARYAEDLLHERQLTQLPPFSHMAILRAEARNSHEAMSLLVKATELAQQCKQSFKSNAIELLGPIPAPMERRAGRSRCQLILQAQQRPMLQKFLTRWVQQLHHLRGHHNVRWSLDVDPIDMM